MNKLVKKQINLPTNIGDLTKFVLIGREKLTSVRAEIKAIDKLNLAGEVREQKKEEATMLAGALLDAEVKIGELTNEIPTQQGARTDIKPIRTTANKLDEISKLGFNKDQVSRFQQMAKHTDIVEQVKAEAKDNDDLPTRTEVLKRIKLLNKTTEKIDDSLKIEISEYGKNIYFNSGEAIESRWDDHIITGDTYPTLTRIGRFFHKDGIQFSLREYARVQDFPDDYKFVGTYSAIKSQLGNAVSPKMAQYIGKELKGKTFIDLFAGCGGLSCGLESIGKKAVYANEYEKTYFQTYVINHKDTICSLKNIFDVKIDDIPDADIVVGGPPCQGFSTAGLRLKNDPRNKLYQQFLRIVNGKKTKEFLMENVPQIAEIKDQIIQDFNEIGYNVVFKIINGIDIGMKQSRKRAFFIGTKI
jgi:site-specific DNA-cytosine methylase